MDSLTFLVKVLDIVIWPLVIIVLGIIYKSPLTGLINQLANAKVKYSNKDGDTFEAQLNTIRQKIEGKEIGETTEASREQEEIEGSNNLEDEPRFLRKSEQIKEETSPLDVINKSWNELEQTAVSTVSISGWISPLKIAASLIDKKYLNENEAEALIRLYGLKQDVNNPENKIVTDVSSASSYKSLAHTLSTRIKTEAGNAIAGGHPATIRTVPNPKQNIEDN